MDLENQNRVKAAAEEHGAENVIVVIGAAEAEAAGLAAETVTNGDPTFAGSLAGVPLGLRVYHCIEQEFKSQVDSKVFEEQIGMMEMVLNVDEIVTEMTHIRNQFWTFKDSLSADNNSEEAVIG
jgi:betaine reductase